ncbi:hypothetical protein ACFYKX_10090 [Cytobacillus sp. FJAT-54145]|uniref:Uncharacterized protein n=1 Tax=Cytobacillus spartinae TaxID=3299023 RepID=A0ABW6K9V7_9BACI
METIYPSTQKNEVLIGQDSANGDGGGGLSGPSEFERILDQAAGNGLNGLTRLNLVNCWNPLRAFLPTT